MSRSQAMAADVAALIRSRVALLWIVTREEARVERSLLDAAQAAKGYKVRFWDCATGCGDEQGKPVPVPNGDPQQALAAIREQRERCVWVLRDLHQWLRDPFVLRGLRSLARMLPETARDEARTIVVLSPSGEVPPELAGHAVVVEWPLPDREEVAQILDSVLAGMPPTMAEKVSQEAREAAVDAAIGLTAEEAGNCYAKSVVTAKTIDPKAVANEKKRVIARERVLEWFDPDPRGLEAVGGLEVLKDWLRNRRSAFSKRARDFGLPAPKGVVLLGVPGCGKSLTAKAVASAWAMPLLKLDMGALKSKYVGESEANIRKALNVAETVAPCILWLDEIEKALGGAVQGAADGGVSADALGAILNWMQERKGSVFVVATSNDVSALPPELLRKGRFDEIFWVDLPTTVERVAVLTSALKAHGRELSAPDVERVAAECRDFTGAEIASLVPDALFAAFADGERALTADDLLRAVKTVVPLSKTAAERLKTQREWATNRARHASAASVVVEAKAARALDIDNSEVN